MTHAVHGEEWKQGNLWASKGIRLPTLILIYFPMQSVGSHTQFNIQGGATNSCDGKLGTGQSERKQGRAAAQTVLLSLFSVEQ